jgi:hypothetical protein
VATGQALRRCACGRPRRGSDESPFGGLGELVGIVLASQVGQRESRREAGVRNGRKVSRHAAHELVVRGTCRLPAGPSLAMDARGVGDDALRVEGFSGTDEANPASNFGFGPPTWSASASSACVGSESRTIATSGFALLMAPESTRTLCGSSFHRYGRRRNRSTINKRALGKFRSVWNGDAQITPLVA